MANPFGSTIVVDGTSIRPPTRIGPTLFEKPSWVSDAACGACVGCRARFTQLRRRHHCRHCGNVFCSRCTPDQIPLPHFGMAEPEKVCSNCRQVVELMLKAKSQDALLIHEAVLGFSSLLTNVAGLSKVIECGGIHTMLSVAMDGDTKLKAAVASALHSVAQTLPLNPFLVEVGCLKAIKNFLSTSEFDELLSDSLSTLNLLCMDPAIRIQVVQERLVDSLLCTVRSASGIPSVFASRILQLLVSHFEHHDFILQNHKRVVPELFDALKTEDYLMQECVSKMLMYFSASSSAFRDMIIYEEARGGLLVLLRVETRPGVLVHVVCIVANIALSMQGEQTPPYISGLCELLPLVDAEENSEILTQIGRGLANFAESSSNAPHIIPFLPSIASRLLRSAVGAPRVHACRLLVALFSSPALPSALDVLSQSGLDEFIETIFDLPGIADILNNLLLRKVSRLSVCTQHA